MIPHPDGPGLHRHCRVSDVAISNCGCGPRCLQERHPLAGATVSFEDVDHREGRNWWQCVFCSPNVSSNTCVGVRTQAIIFIVESLVLEIYLRATLRTTFLHLRARLSTPHSLSHAVEVWGLIVACFLGGYGHFFVAEKRAF